MSGIASSSARFLCSASPAFAERTLVREREPGCRVDSVEQLRTEPQRAVVHEHSDRLALVQDRRRDADRAPLGQRERRAGAVDVPAVRRGPAQPQRGIAERAPERLLEADRLRRIAQLEQQLADRRLREPSPDERREEGARQRERRDQREPEAEEAGTRRERSEHEPEREEQQGDRPSDHHRQVLPAGRGRGRTGTARQHEDGDERDACGDRGFQLLQTGRERRLRVDQRQVGRVSAVVARERVEEHRQRLQHDHVEVGDDEDTPGDWGRAGRSGTRAARARGPRRRGSTRARRPCT